MALVQLSVEEYISNFTANDGDIQESLVLTSILPNEDDGSPANNVSSPCDSIYLIDPQNCGIEKSELDLYLPGLRSSKGHTIDDHAFYNDLRNLFGQSIHGNIQAASKSNHIPLSRSVDVTIPKKPKNPSHQIQIGHDLELNHKPRYKSDCFSQNGRVRQPRYVADNLGNHFVTLKVVPGIHGLIRVDWVTVPDEKNIRYSMPHRFQQNHKSRDVPDCNPMYINIDADSFGIMKLYLVLIKSKQDELKLLQPLKPFHLFQDAFGIPNKKDTEQTIPLNPKRLIEKYQLNKSQLAFTYCALGPDGQLGIPEWDTTVYSTVLTEMPVSNSKKRMATCPNCLHSFELIVDGADDIGHEKIIKKRKK